jgi:hypothetical protein
LRVRARGSAAIQSATSVVNWKNWIERKGRRASAQAGRTRHQAGSGSSVDDERRGRRPLGRTSGIVTNVTPTEALPDAGRELRRVSSTHIFSQGTRLARQSAFARHTSVYRHGVQMCAREPTLVPFQKSASSSFFAVYAGIYSDAPRSTPAWKPCAMVVGSLTHECRSQCLSQIERAPSDSL